MSPRLAWATVTLAPTIEPGQFFTRYGSKCAECGEFIRKNDVAGYNPDDQIVCEECWIPLSGR